jgi:hypothetical protein
MDEDEKEYFNLDWFEHKIVVEECIEQETADIHYKITVHTLKDGSKVYVGDAGDGRTAAI